MMGGVFKEFRFAVRQIARRPGFSLLVALTLAVGIGANVAIFSVLKGLVLRALPYPEPERVVAVWETETGSRTYQPFAPPDYLDMRERNTSFAELGVCRFYWVNLSDESEATRNYAAITTASTLRALGVSPALGRLFTDEEELAGNDRVAILSDGLWKRQYGGDPDILGRSIAVDGEDFTVIGVMPEDYEFPRPWDMMSEDPELWVPLTLPRDGSQRGSHYLAAIGRLKDGVTVGEAEADLKRIAASLAETYPDTNAQVDVWIDQLTQRSLGYVRSVLLILLAVVGLVLLIACANVASMLLARGSTRTTELAIRASMGAGRGRLVRLLLTESLVLSSLGGVIGVLLAMWGVSALKQMIPSYVPRTAGIVVDGQVLIFAVLISVGSALLFGLVPALFSSSIDLGGALREGRGSQAATRKQRRFLGALVAGQLATAFVLANGAGLLIKSYANVHDVPYGFDTQQVLVAGISTNGPAYAETEQRVAFWDQLVERLEALPGVEYAAATNKLPTAGGTNGSILVEGERYDPAARRPLVEYSYVSPDYFRAMGIALLSGRLLEDRDRVVAGATEELNIVVNQAFAERYWPGESALGKRVRSNTNPPEWTATIVGVVENVPQWGVEFTPLREIYFHHSFNMWYNTQLVVRAAAAPSALVPGIRDVLRQLDRRVPLAGVRTMGDVLSQATQRRRFFMTLVSLFAVTALILVVAGTYGVMSYYVSRRTHEIGVRVALGANNHRVLKLFLAQGLRVVLSGVGVGLIASMAAAYLMRGLLYGVSPFSPTFLAGSALFMTAVALAAISAPVSRALHVDPNEALRAE